MTQLLFAIQTWYASRSNDERGVTAIEYGLLAALVAVGIITAATFLGTSLSDLFNNIGGKVDVIVP